MTAFIAKNATESIGFIKTDADDALTKWAVELSTEYISIPTSVYELMPGAGSDYVSVPSSPGSLSRICFYSYYGH